MLNSKFFRVGLGVIALFIFVISFAPSVFTYKAIDGVVNARVQVVTSPIEGELQYHSTEYEGRVEVGDRVRKGQLIGKVTDVNMDYGYYYELQTERLALEERVRDLALKTAALIELKRDLSLRLEDYKVFTIQELGAKQDTLREIMQGDREELIYLKKRTKRVAKLAKMGVEAKLNADQAKAEMRQLVFKVEAAKKELSRLDVRIAAANKYVFMGDGHNDSAYSNQRMDQIEMEIASVRALQSETKERIEQIKFQGNKEMDRIRTRRVKDVKSPVGGIVWQLPISEGDSVVIADNLVRVIDCHKIFLDVLSDEINFDEMSRGNMVEYRLYGDKKFHKGFIDTIHGSGMIYRNDELAASIEARDSKQSRVTISISNNDLAMFQTEEKSCNVGRKVIVRFNREFNASKVKDNIDLMMKIF